MDFPVTVAICTFGDDSWRDLAENRAIPSALRQGVPVVAVHGETLHGSRNRALEVVETEWIVYLDADDELDLCFVSNMTVGTADLRAPSIRFIRSNGDMKAPRMPRVAGHVHNCSAECLAFGNWLVVGTAARVQMLKDVGGWRDWPCYEDWDLWARCWKLGATVQAMPRAIYIAHVRQDSRNRAGVQSDRNEVHREIARDLGLPIPK